MKFIRRKNKGKLKEFSHWVIERRDNVEILVPETEEEEEEYYEMMREKEREIGMNIVNKLFNAIKEECMEEYSEDPKEIISCFEIHRIGSIIITAEEFLGSGITEEDLNNLKKMPSDIRRECSIELRRRIHREIERIRKEMKLE